MAIPRFWDLTKVISVNKINRSIVVREIVSCEVRIEFLVIIYMKSTLQRVSTSKLMKINIFDLRVYL
jgi:hypothetical protein